MRGAFPEASRLDVLASLDGDALPWLRPNRSGPRADIRVLGVTATPTFETPGGPPVDAYFDDARRYTALYEQLFAGITGHIEALLGRLSGGRPVERLVNGDGRAFAACTIRSLPEGQRIIVHNDYHHFRLPLYREVIERLDTTASLSFLILLQAPEQGGKLVIHGLRHDDETPRLASGLPDGDTIERRYRCVRLKMVAGDLLVFAAGRYYHHVAAVIGSRPRVTLGGFLTFDREHRKVLYWN